MHTSDMNPDNIKGNIMASAPVKSTRIRYVVVKTTVRRLHIFKLGLEEAFLDLASALESPRSSAWKWRAS